MLTKHAKPFKFCPEVIKLQWFKFEISQKFTSIFLFTQLFRFSLNKLDLPEICPSVRPFFLIHLLACSLAFLKKATESF